VGRHGSLPPSGIDHGLAHLLARRTLRASVGLSFWKSTGLILFGLGASWFLVHLAGGAGKMVPHWYYVPILFAATRFGPLAALITAVLAGIMAGPLTFESVAAGSSQEPIKWLTRAGFFIGIGQVTAWLLAPSLRPLGEEVRRVRTVHRIRRALARKEFFLVYQPIYSVSENRFCGVEALVRWRHPDRGELSPAHFMEVIEESDLIYELSDFVLEEACRQAGRWRVDLLRQGDKPWYMAINLSARDLERPELSKHIAEVLERYDLPPELLMIELTEGVLAMDQAGFTLHQLRKLGVRVAIDDFGTGWSSLAYLRRFPVDVIKIDRSLIANLGPSESSQALARGVIALARSLGLATIAEGLETDEQLAIGRELEFDYVQGYLLSRPQPPSRLGELLNNGAAALRHPDALKGAGSGSPCT
jgi:diguanylate cyclase